MKRSALVALVFAILLIGVVGCGNKPPTVSITSPADGERVNVNTTVTFKVRGEDKDLPQGTKLTYFWDFDDGTKQEMTNTSIKHPYSKPGRYVVKVVAIDDKGAKSEEDTVTIIVNEPPKASLRPSTEEGAAPLQVHFNAIGSRDDVQIVKYEWDLDGDGRIDAEGLQASKTYEKPGTYLVKLIVTDNDGAKGEAIISVRVLPPQIAQICFDEKLERHGSCGEGIPDPEVYVIPENHALKEVRKNIREIINILAGKLGPKGKLVLLLEGEKEGKRISSPVNALPEALVQNIMGILLRRGGLSAAEYLYLADPRLQLIGAEDQEAYNKHLGWAEGGEDRELLRRQKTICRKGRQVIADYELSEVAEAVIQASLLLPVCEGRSDQFPEQFIAMNANAVLQLIYPKEASQLLEELEGISRGQASDAYEEAAAHLREVEDILPSIWKIAEDLGELILEKAPQEKIHEKRIELYKKIFRDLREPNTESFLYLMEYHNAVKARGIRVPRIEDTEKPALSLQKKSYDLLRKRDEAMAENAKNLRDAGDITEERPAVLIIGYFHLLGVTAELKAREIDYQVIIPFGLEKEATPAEGEAMECRRKGSAYVLCNLAPRSGTPKLRPPAVIDKPLFLEYEIPFLYQSILVDQLVRKKLDEGKPLEMVKNEVRDEIQQITSAYNQALQAWSKGKMQVRLEAEFDSISFAGKTVYSFFRDVTTTTRERVLFARLGPRPTPAPAVRESVLSSLKITDNLWVEALNLKLLPRSSQAQLESLLQGRSAGGALLPIERADGLHLVVVIKGSDGAIHLRELSPEEMMKLEDVDWEDITSYEATQPERKKTIDDFKVQLLEPLLEALSLPYSLVQQRSEFGVWDAYKIEVPEGLSPPSFAVPEMPKLRALLAKFLTATQPMFLISSYSTFRNLDHALSMEIDGPIRVLVTLPSRWRGNPVERSKWEGMIKDLVGKAAAVGDFELSDATNWDKEKTKGVIQEALRKGEHLLVFGALAEGADGVEIGGQVFSHKELQEIFDPKQFPERVRRGKIAALLSCFGYIHGISDVSIKPEGVGFAPSALFKREHVQGFLDRVLSTYIEKHGRGEKVTLADWLKPMMKALPGAGVLFELFLLPQCIDLEEDEGGRLPCISSEEGQRG